MVGLEESDDEELSELESMEEAEFSGGQARDTGNARERKATDGSDSSEDQQMVDFDDEEDAENETDLEDEDLDSDGVPRMTIPDQCPDLNKLTRRQRSAYEEYDGELMSLSNEAQKKKHLTAEEYAMRRQELARRRKNLSEKRNEEEKMDTINRLLKKQAPKRRSRAAAAADQAAEGLLSGNPGSAEEQQAEEEPPKPNPIYFRLIDRGEKGKLAAFPEEWLSGPLSLGLTPMNPPLRASEDLKKAPVIMRRPVEEVE